MKLAAIDIGSNAIRLLIAEVLDFDRNITVKKLSLTRVAVRLGEDVFTKGKISDEKVKKLVKTMKAFRHLMEVYEVEDFRATATSAMREAKNGKEVVATIKEQARVKIDIIDGKTEASYIFHTFFTQPIDRNAAYLYIDVGGGSTEVTLLEGGKPIQSKSFKIGTIRILKDKVRKEDWKEMKEWVRSLKIDGSLMAIGTGGNINKLIKLCNVKDTNIVAYEKLATTSNWVSSFSMKERMNLLNLRYDRADVIVPASQIYLTIMRIAGVNKIMVPKLGLADGVVYSLYYERQQPLSK